MTTENSLSRVDHLIYAVPDLEKGMDDLEQLLGVRPAPGGRHSNWGTHNALVSLGSATYLEVMAPDHARSRLLDSVLFDLDTLPASKLLTWVYREEYIDEAHSRAQAEGLVLGDVQTGSRLKTDGTSLDWRLTDPSVLPLDGAIPFLISWGQTPHPGATAPACGRLLDLKIEHPDPSAVTGALTILDINLPVLYATSFALTATIETKMGPVILR